MHAKYFVLISSIICPALLYNVFFSAMYLHDVHILHFQAFTTGGAHIPAK